MIKSLPNTLTTLRICLIPFICFSFYLEDTKLGSLYGALAFFIACLTDYFDGYLARKYKIQSKFGIVFDPIADKLLVTTVLIMLCSFQIADPIASTIIICREIFVSGIRELSSGGKISIPVTILSKAKTFIQMAAITILMLRDINLEILAQMGQSLLWVAAFLSAYTGLQHYKIASKLI